MICIIVPQQTFSLESAGEDDFPKQLSHYKSSDDGSLFTVLIGRIKEEPFNLISFVIFLLAIIHTFLTNKFLAISRRLHKNYQVRIDKGEVPRNSMHMGGGILHFLGEIEAVFGLWVIILIIGISFFYSWDHAVEYIAHNVHYTEAMFVIVMMTIASSRPVIKMFELLLWKVTQLFGGKIETWWLVILIFGPISGAFIGEAAAMTISACLLAEKFYSLNPPQKLKYATLGILFVNISVGGAISNFTAPPVLMVAGPWGWDLTFMFLNFGWKVILGILIVNFSCFFYFKNDLRALQENYKIQSFKKYIQRRYLDRQEIEDLIDSVEIEINDKLEFTRNFDEVCKKIEAEIKEKAVSALKQHEIEKYGVGSVIDDRFEDLKLSEMKKTIPGLLPKDLRPPYRDPEWDNREDRVPLWIMFIHALFMLWTVINGREPVLFIGGFLFFLGFMQVTPSLQNRINLKPPLMVGFFLSGLIIHGGLQGWWIEPLLGRLSEIPLLLSAVVLTAFNDNASITYLSTLVPGLTEGMKYSIVAGAVTGGGLTIIANAPNPVGVSILKKYFKTSISPLKLLKSALIPTAFFLVVFIVF
jgi:hypothetical protein